MQYPPRRCARRVNLATFIVLFFVPCVAWAAALPYRFDSDGSVVAFTYSLGQDARQGTMPVTSAQIALDLDTLSASRVTITLSAARARAGVFFATQAMRGPQVLDTERFPRIIFRATRIRGSLNAATVTGDLTVRDVTRPVTLEARLYRARGTDPEQRDDLVVRLTGSISRSAFGADGFSGLVGDRIDLDIMAHIVR